MFRFFKRKGWLIFLLAFLLLFPPAIKSQAKLNNRVLITGLAIDKTESGYMVTAQLVMPNPSSEASGQNATFEFVCEEGESMVEGFKKVAYNIGEIAWHSCANFIILGEELIKQDNVIKDLDYFMRDPHLPNSAMLVFCKGRAEEMIRKTAELKLSVGLGLQKIYMYKEESLSAKMMPMQTFVDDCFSPSGTSVLSAISISVDDENKGGGAQIGGSENGSEQEMGAQPSSDSGAAPQKGRINFLEPIAYFKNGKFKGILENENEIMAYLLTASKTDRFDLVIKDVNDGVVYKNAKVGLRVASKKCGVDFSYKNNSPVATIKITLDKLTLLEVLNQNNTLNAPIANLNSYLNNTLYAAIKSQIETDIKQLLSKTKQQNVDIFDIANFAYKFKHKEFEEFLKTKNNIDNYIEDIDLNVAVEVKDFVK